MSKILVAGGSGLVGRRLCQLLTEQNHDVAILSRSAKSNKLYPVFQWDPILGQINERAFDGVEHIINLAGAGIADSAWTPKQKKLIIDSRVKSNELLINTLLAKNKKVKSFISASAVGYYGDRGTNKLSESASPGNDGFLSETCIQWEASAKKADLICDRLSIIRIGVVLSTKGGALEKMLLPFRFGMGNYFGDGSAYMPWIHIDDICQLFIKVIEEEKMTGVYNGVAPTAVTGKVMAKAIKKAIGRPALIFPVPTFALKVGLGERVTMLINSNRVVPERTVADGFTFRFPKLALALKDILEKKK